MVALLLRERGGVMKPKRCICGSRADVMRPEPESKKFQVVCDGCGKSSLEWNTEAEAIKNWNGGKHT